MVMLKECGSLKTILFAHEAGVSFLDENLKVIDKIAYVKNAVLEYQTLLKGEESDLLQKIVVKLGTMPTEQILVQTKELRDAVSKVQPSAETLSEEDLSKVVSEKVRIILDSGFAESEEKAYAKLREFSLRQSEIRIAEQSARLDLQAMQSVLALDELDKTINILGTRVKEWYFIHFPEILQFYDDPIEICKFVADVGDRKNVDDERLERTKFSENKREALYDAAQRSRGGTFREGDMERLIMLAEQTKELAEIRKRMADFTEKIMNQIAPNLTNIIGATIGARLIARAGGLENLSRLPASTIQVLGAEKALFRAIKTGARPPKHGIIFQHTLIHEAPKWQRGRIARALAAKIAIAARIDFYRKEFDPSVNEDLMNRIKEIRKSKEKIRGEERQETEFRRQRRKQKKFGQGYRR